MGSSESFPELGRKAVTSCTAQKSLSGGDCHITSSQSRQLAGKCLVS